MNKIKGFKHIFLRTKVAEIKPPETYERLHYCKGIVTIVLAQDHPHKNHMFPACLI